jgi:hypothetical protein
MKQIHLDKIIAGASGDDADRKALSRRLNNLFLPPVRAELAATLEEILEAANAATTAPAARDVLHEHFVTMFFHRHVAELTGPGAGNAADLRPYREGIGALSRQHREMLLAGFSYLQGRIETAYDHFDQARAALLREGELRHHNRGLLSLRPMALFQSWARPGAATAGQPAPARPHLHLGPAVQRGPADRRCLFRPGLLRALRRPAHPDQSRARQSASAYHQSRRCRSAVEPECPVFR